MASIILWVNGLSTQCVGHCFEREMLFIVTSPVGEKLNPPDLRVGDIVCYDIDNNGKGRLFENSYQPRPCYFKTAIAIKDALKAAS